MRVLVTGGAGFIGSHVVRFHLDRSDEVVVVDDLSTGSEDNLAAARGEASGGDLRFENAAIEDWPGLDDAVASADRIYHLAAVVGVFRVLDDPLSVLRTNLAGTHRLLEAIERSDSKPQTVVASSSEVYGPHYECALREDLPLTVESTGDPRWAYAVTKLADETLALTHARVGGWPLVVVRLFNTTGPRQAGEYGMVVPRFVRQAVAGEPITVYGDGGQRRCFCDVRDVVEALDRLAAEPGAQGQVVNVGSDVEVSMLDLAAMVRRRSASRSEIIHVPYAEAYKGVGGFRDFAVRRPDLGRLRSLTGLEPRFTLEQTLDEMIARQRANLEQGVEPMRAAGD